MPRPTVAQLFSVLAAFSLAQACGKGEKAEGSAKRADSAAVPAVAPAPDPEPTFTDANVLAKLDADNVADSSAGAMAATKGSLASVKEFGRVMMKDHHVMRVAGAAVASTAGIAPAMRLGDADAAADAAVADSMTAMPRGAAWDKYFADHQVAGHTKVLQFAQDAVNHTQNGDLKAMIQKAAPTIQKHLDRAKAIQGTLGGAAEVIKSRM